MGHNWIFLLCSSICIAQDMNTQYAFNQLYQQLQSQFPSVQTMQSMQPSIQSIQPGIQSFQSTMLRSQPFQSMQPTLQSYQSPMQAIQTQQPSYYPQVPQHPTLRYQQTNFRTIRKQSHHNLHDSDYESYEDYDCGYCSCEMCMNPEPCCQPVCEVCVAYQPPKQQDVVLVPYPYPVILTHSENSSNGGQPQAPTLTRRSATVTNEQIEKTTKRSDPGTKIEIVKTPEPTKINPIPRKKFNNEKTIVKVYENATKPSSKRTTAVPENSRRNIESDDWSNPEYTTPSIRIQNKQKGQNTNINVLDDLLFKDSKNKDSSVKRLQPGWEPKYGIVPIPDELALTLMEQLRNIKLIQARRHATNFIANSRRATNPLNNYV